MGSSFPMFVVCSQAVKTNKKTNVKNIQIFFIRPPNELVSIFFHILPTWSMFLFNFFEIIKKPDKCLAFKIDKLFIKVNRYDWHRCLREQSYRTSPYAMYRRFLPSPQRINMPN